MVHWAFLILAFFAGAASCCGVLWYWSRVYARVMKAFEDVVKKTGIGQKIRFLPYPSIDETCGRRAGKWNSQ